MTGWFPPGVSGNPGGRPRRTEVEKLTVKLTRQEAQASVERLMGKAIQAVERALKSKDPAISLRAAVEVLDRGLGKATQRIEGTFSGPETVTHVTPEMLKLAAQRLLAAEATDVETRP